MNASFAIGGVTTALGGVLTALVPLDVDVEQHYPVSTPAVIVGGVAVATTASLLGRHGWRGARPWVVVGLISTLASVLLTVRLDHEWVIRYRLPGWTFGPYPPAR